MTHRPWLAALLLGALLPATAAHASTDQPDAGQRAALSLIEPALDADGASRAVWPDWDISENPLLLVCRDGCFLVHHPRPPAGFHRLLNVSGIDMSVYRGPRDGADAPVTVLGRSMTAVVSQDEIESAAPRVVYERAFLSHEVAACGEAAEPVDLLSGYPVDARNLVLSDIECELLTSAEEALADEAEASVVESLAREFVSIRTFRRILMGDRFAGYERRLELRHGVPAYVASCMLRRATAERSGAIFEEALASCAPRVGSGLGDRPWCSDPGLDLSWYRLRRFELCGESICMLLDATVPDWKQRVLEDCVDPYSLLEERFRLEAPRPSRITPRFDYETRLEERALFAEDALTPAERRFRELTRGDSLRFCINTHLLANVSVSFERATMTEIDRHRQVHERILRLEFSGTTRLELVGRPCGVVVENDAYDVRQVILPAPEMYTLSAGGRRVALTNGIHEIDEPHRVEARGFLLEAERSVVFVSDERITFVIHR